MQVSSPRTTEGPVRERRSTQRLSTGGNTCSVLLATLWSCGLYSTGQGQGHKSVVRGSQTLVGARRIWAVGVLSLVVILGTLTTHSQANHVHMHGGPFIGVVLSVAVDPLDHNRVYCAAYGGGVFRSNNSGATWVAINQGLPDRQVYSLLVHPKNPSQIYVGTDQGVFMSLDRGNSWKSLTSVLKERNIRAIAIDPKEPKLIYAATDRGVFLGRGGSWKGLSQGLLSQDVRSLKVSPKGDLYAGTFNGVFKKQPGEDFWAPINSGLTDPQVRTLAIDPLSPDTLYAGTASGGVFKTTSAGKRWEAVNRGLSNTTILALAVSPTRPSTLYAGTIGGVFKSPNGGNEWLATGSEGLLTVTTLALDPAGLDLLYAGSGGRLFKSTNAGKKWKEVGSQINHFGPVEPLVR